MWELTFNRDRFSVEAAAAKGRKLPDWFLEEPPLMPGDDFYLTAFWDLNTCRQNGMSHGPIPWDKTVDYGDRAGLDGDMVKLFECTIRAMDRAYLEWQGTQSDKDRTQGQTSSKTGAQKTGSRGTHNKK